MSVKAVIVVFATSIACTYGEALLGMLHTPTDIAWWDKGSGAHADFTCFKSQHNDGQTTFVLGHHGQGNFNDAENKMVAVRPLDDATALKEPMGFREIWNDRGSGAHMDGAVMRPLCPIGYVSLGDIMYEGHGCCPSFLTDEVRCLKSEYAEATTIGSGIWVDKGSGADADVKIWSVDGSPGYFYANGNYEFEPDVQAYKLRDDAILVF